MSHFLRFFQNCSWAAILFVWAVSTCQAQLINPWDQKKADAHTAVAPGGSCPATFSVPQDLKMQGFYTDKSSSVIDPAKFAAAKKNAVIFRTAAREIVALADDYQLNFSVESAHCAAAWLLQLAQENALGGKMTGQQASFVQTWMLNAYATAWLKVRSESGLKPNEIKRIDSWLVGIANSLRRFYEKRGKTNNLLYWGGLAAVSVGIAANDKSLFDWGVTCYMRGIESIKSDGTLSAEMGRGDKALSYHIFAVTPLVMIAELAGQNGIDLFKRNGFALKRLVDVTAEGVRDPKYFDSGSGVKQRKMSLEKAQLIWLRVFAKHFPDRAYDDLISNNTTTSNLYLGGDFKTYLNNILVK